MKDDPKNVNPGQPDPDSLDSGQPDYGALGPNQGHDPTDPGQTSPDQHDQEHGSLDHDQANSDSDQPDQGHDSPESNHPDKDRESLDPDQLEFGADYQVSPDSADSETAGTEENATVNPRRSLLQDLALGAIFLALVGVTVFCVITSRNANLRANAAEQARLEAEETLSKVTDSLHLIESSELLSQSDFSTFSPDLLRWTDRYGIEHLMKCYLIRVDDTHKTSFSNGWFTDDGVFYNTPSYDEIGEQIVYRETRGGSDHDKLIVESHQWLKTGDNRVISIDRYYEEMELPSDERYSAEYANRNYVANFCISDTQIPFRLDESDSITAVSFTDDVVYQGPTPSRSPCGCLNCCCDDCTCGEK